jgi:hypothetical protein
MSHLQKAILASLSVLVLSVFASGAWGQSSPVYVSGGPFIYQASGGTLTLIFTASSDSGTNFESLAAGPDNVDLDTNGNAAHPFLLYACDITGKTIIRFDPASPDTAETVYPPSDSSVAGLVPVCGRFSSTGDFYITNQAASETGGNVYKFAGIANVKLGHLTSLQQTPTAVSLSGVPGTFTGGGITQKNTGDLLVVDTADSQVLRFPYGPPFGAAASFGSGLSSPVGIARVSTGDVFVANQGSSNVAHFDRTGASAGTCPSLTFPEAGNTRLFFLAASETDKIYAAASTSNSVEFAEDLDFLAETDNPGEVWTWSPGQTAEQGVCTLQPVVSSKTLLFGVAVAPVPTATQSQVLNGTLATFNFNSNVFQIKETGCTATVTAYPLNLATVNTAIGLAASSLPDGATPLVNLGEGGYEIAYVAKTPGCTGVNGFSLDAIFGLYDSALSGNPRVIQCDSNPFDDPTEPLLNGTNTCAALTTVGSYPLGGIIPKDGGVFGKGKGGHSVFFLVNANLRSAAAGGQAIFCGFFPPLKNTTDPTKAANFDDDDIIPVMFRLAKAGGSCQAGPFDNSAQALLSIAQLTPTFNPIFPLQTFPPGGNFQNLGFGLYLTLLPVHFNHLAPGEYSLSVLFQTDDTSQQTIVFNVGTNN